MLSTRDAFEKLQAMVQPLTTERVALEDAFLRVLAAPLASRIAKPAANLSAMDGYAVNSADLKAGATTGLALLKGESAAGTPYDLIVPEDHACRIFTGAILPNGTDQVIPQEDVTVNAGQIAVSVDPAPGRHVRPAAADFDAKETLLDAGTLLTPKSIGLIAAGGYGHVMVHRAPKISVLVTGDEIVKPGDPATAPAQMVDSASPMIVSMLKDAGAEIDGVSYVKDDLEATKAALQTLGGSDLIITIGGASVGDHDHLGDALKAIGASQEFWKIAMRPGKPLMAGKLGRSTIVGLPGNPVSAFVCCLLFCRPLVDKMMGRPSPFPEGVPVPIAAPLPAEGARDHYRRARLVMTEDGPKVDPAQDQDSSLLSVLAACDGLLLRPANAPACNTGDLVSYLPF